MGVRLLLSTTCPSSVAVTSVAVNVTWQPASHSGAIAIRDVCKSGTMWTSHAVGGKDGISKSAISLENMMEPLEFRMAMGLVAGHLLMTGCSVVTKLSVAPVSAMLAISAESVVLVECGVGVGGPSISSGVVVVVVVIGVIGLSNKLFDATCESRILLLLVSLDIVVMEGSRHPYSCIDELAQ